jgi:hypothetical protein
MFELDKYTIKARLYPSFIVLLPIYILCLFYVTDIQKYYHYLTAIISAGLFTFLLSQLGRDMGKKKEPILFKHWGGKPTTLILRHRNNYLDNITKERYHKLLALSIVDLIIPSFKEEQINPTYADKVYESCVKFLISKTRDTKKYSLLFKENINYGFRRNLWGMKFLAICILLICLVIHFYISSHYFSIMNNFTIKDIVLYLFLFATILFWLFIVNKNWIKLIAFAYAERLFETLNNLD